MNKTSSQVALVAGSSGIVGRQLVNTRYIVDGRLSASATAPCRNRGRSR